MNATIEERVTALEREVERLAEAIAPDLVWRDGWELTVGASAGDPGFEEMIRLGAEYRRCSQQR
jgi:hypothetical protein